MCNTYSIEATRGDTIPLTFSVTGDYSSSTFAMQVRTSPSASSSTISLTEGSGITKTYADGITTVVCTITATQSATLDPDTVYSYDVQVTTGSVVKTWFGGPLSLEADSTR